MSAAAATILSIGAYRQARSSDVNNSNLSAWARAVYKDFCTHINPQSNNVAWPKKATQAGKLAVSVRTVARARNELLEKHWICLPAGDSGGREFSKETRLEPRGQAVRIHLHPDGQPCAMQQPERKQRLAASRRMAVKGDRESSFRIIAKDDKLSVKGDKLSNANKEGTSPIELPPTTTRAREETETPVAGAGADPEETANPESPVSGSDESKDFGPKNTHRSKTERRTANAKLETSGNAGSEEKTSNPKNPVSALDAADSPTAAAPMPAAITEVRPDHETPGSKEWLEKLNQPCTREWFGEVRACIPKAPGFLRTHEIWIQTAGGVIKLAEHWPSKTADIHWSWDRCFGAGTVHYAAPGPVAAPMPAATPENAAKNAKPEDPGPKEAPGFNAFGQNSSSGKRKSAPLPKQEELPLPAPIDDPLVRQITKRGVSEKKARELLANLKPGQESMDQLAYVDSLIAKDRRGKFDNPPGLYVVYVRDNIAPPAEFCSTRKARLHEQAQQAKNADRARQAQLEIDYDEYQAAEIRRCIGETMPGEEYQRMFTQLRQDNQHIFKQMTPAQLDELTARAVAAELKQSDRVPLLSFEEFCVRKEVSETEQLSI